jgi:hypothetical protein
MGREVVHALQRDPVGEQTGKLEVRPNSQVLRIEHDASGKVTGVVYADKDGVQHRQAARIVAVAGNSIEARGCCSTRRRACSPTGWRTPRARSERTTCAT